MYYTINIRESQVFSRIFYMNLQKSIGKVVAIPPAAYRSGGLLATCVEEAATIFIDDRTEYYSDEKNSNDEERFIAVGISNRFNVLIVCHCLRENETIIRIISARKAEKHEQKRGKR